MELAITAITAIGHGIGSLLGIGGEAAGTAATTAGGFSGLQAFTTVLSALGTIGSGAAAAAQSREAADEADLQAGQDKVQSTQRQTQMKRTLMQVLGENDVAFASAGIDLNGGIAQASADTAKKRASEELTIDRRDEDFRQALFKLRASNLRSRAGSQMGGALIGALGQVANVGLDLSSRGGASTSSGYDPWAGLRIANG
jgi:hypothetical protein